MMLQCDEYWENWDDEQREQDYQDNLAYEQYLIDEEMAYYAQFSSQEDYNEYLAACNAFDSDTPLALEYYGG